MHRHAAAATSDGWEAIELDLGELDAAAAARSAGLDSRVGQESSARAARHRHSRHYRASRPAGRANSSEFNRRIQLVLFVTLLLVGLVVVVRACGGASRSAEPDATPIAAFTPTRPPHLACLP